MVTIADALGMHGADANPHLWYDVPRSLPSRPRSPAAWSRADPAHAAAYRAGLRRFVRQPRPLRRRSPDSRFDGAPVAYTEPVPGYLLAAAGLRNLTPDSFSRAVEDGTEPTLSGVGDVRADRRTAIRVLLYNNQTVSP